MQKILFAILAISLPLGSAFAVPVTVDFTVSDFTEVGLSDPPPSDPISGTIVYEAASATDPISSLTSVSLTIDGHNYSLAEVGFVSPFGPNTNLIGGVVNLETGLTPNSNDFFFTWNWDTLSPSDFTYASASASGIWTTDNWDEFTVTVGGSIRDVSRVPVPGTLALLGLGLLGLRVSRTAKA